MNLSQACVRVWRETGLGFDFLATGGSTATVVDSACQFTSDSAWVGGTLVVKRDAGGAGAAPEGEFAVITGYTASSKTFATATGAFTTAVAAGDSIFIASTKIKLRQMIEAVNDGLADLGYIRNLDTSISVTSGTVQYTLPVALKATDLVDVLFQEETTEVPHSIKNHCRVEPSAGGSTAVLWVDGDYTGTLRIIYNGLHPKLTAFNSAISETIPEALVVAAAKYKALTWIVNKKGQSALGSALMQHLNNAAQTLQNAKLEAPVSKAPRKPRYFSVGTNGTYQDSQ